MIAAPEMFPWKRAVGLSLALIVAYAVAWPFSVFHGAPPVSITAGIGVAALLLGGRKLVPGIAIAGFIAGLALQRDPFTALALGVGASVEALLGAALVRRQVGVLRRLRRPGHVLKLLACFAIAALPSATLIALARAMSGPSSLGLALQSWWPWWQADLLGMLVFTPLILVHSRWTPTKWSAGRTLEFAAYGLSLVAASALMTDSFVPEGFPARLPFVVLPLVIWSSFRFGQRVVTATLAVAAIAASIGSALGHGPFVTGDETEVLTLMLFYTSVVVLTGLALSAVVRDRHDAMRELSIRRDQLEARVRERTLELAHANRALQTDIVARGDVEQRLRDAEARMRLMVDSVVDYAILMLDPQGRITTWNSGAQRIKGYRAEEIIGQHFSRFYPPEESAGGKPIQELETAAREGRFSEEGWRVRKDGTRFWAGVVLTAIRDDTGNLIGFAKVTRDLTERRRYEAQLMEAKATAERANEAKSEFLARMSHELRTPLNSLLILARLLADNTSANLTPKQVRYAETIYGAGSDLLSLIDDVLDLARVESGAVNQVIIAPVSLAELTGYLEGTFRQLSRDRDLGFRIECSPDAPATLETDGRRLQQILKNLLANAFKFTSSGEVALNVTADGTGNVCFAVSDTGIGIPAEKQQLVFEAFRQADDTTSRQYGGSGLGLAISREFARLLGGSIALQSRPGHGSTFTLHIPRIAPSPLRGEETPA